MRRLFAGGMGGTLWATATNLAIVGVSLVASILVARSLGPEGRGEFATLMAIFTITLVVGELGQSAAVTYHAAASELDAADVVAAGRRIMMIASGATCAVVVAAVIALLGGETEHVVAYAIALIGCLANALAAPYLYAVQAVDIAAWNRVRLAQPAVYVLLVTGGFATGKLDLVTLAVALVVSTTSSLIYAWVIGRKRGLSGGRVQPGHLRRMTRYGVLASSAGIPIGLGQNLDKVLLAGISSQTFVGHYAVAGTVAGLSQPVATAVASVAFPRVARASLHEDRVRLGRVALIRSTLITLPLTAVIALAGPWVVPFVFGEDFSPAVAILWVLAPGLFVRASNIVMTSLLRGVGRPGAAAHSQVAAAVGFLVGLVPAMSVAGSYGVGVALLVSETIGFAVGWTAWKRELSTRATGER